MKRNRGFRPIALVTCLLLAFCSISAIQPDRLRSHVTWLADSDREGRRAGSPGAEKAAQYISDQFKEIGLTVQMQEFGGNRRNVVARLGSAPNYVVVGAHYDGQGKGFPSASDNAAGVAILIELARELKGANLPASLVFVAFDDEEQGLNGSRYYVDHSPWPLENASAAIIFDTMGRTFIDLRSWTLFVLGTEYSAELSDVLAKHAQKDMLVAGTDLIGPRSDFAGFALKHVPYLFFSHATHQDYHGEGDTPDRVDYTKLAADSALIGQVIRDVAQLKTKPVFRDVPVYPASEIETLERVLKTVKTEKKDIPRAYSLVFDDMEKRIMTDKSRETLTVAASALLALATPRFSPFMLDFIVGPFYEKQQKPEIVAAVKEESARWDK
jgi:Zn-dependent M28 family amino/carboxypeptidase